MEEIVIAFFAFSTAHTSWLLFPISLRWTNRLHGPRLLHPEPLSEQSTVSGLQGPSASHPAEPNVPTPRTLLLWPRQDACGKGQLTYHPWWKPIQLQVRHWDMCKLRHTITYYSFPWYRWLILFAAMPPRPGWVINSLFTFHRGRKSRNFSYKHTQKCPFAHIPKDSNYSNVGAQD